MNRVFISSLSSTLIFVLPPLETQSNRAILNAGFQQREGQRIGTERSIFVQVQRKTERYKSPMSEVSVAEAEN